MDLSILYDYRWVTYFLASVLVVCSVGWARIKGREIALAESIDYQDAIKHPSIRRGVVGFCIAAVATVVIPIMVYLLLNP